MTDCPDPRPLTPPDPDPEPEPRRVWHFLSKDHEHEHWTECPHEAELLYTEYALRGTPYEVTCTLDRAH